MLWKPTLALWVLLFTLSAALAQPANDDCDSSTFLPDATDWCSGLGAFTTVGATSSPGLPGGCLSGAFLDAWFSFIPLATDVTITIIGSSGAGGAGLQLPEIALYEGACGALQLVACEPAPAFGNANELTFSGLSLGVIHYIRVQGKNGGTGNFQLCINTYNAPVEPSSDCPEAAILCNKDPFVVQQVLGPGNDPTEANDADCLNGFGVNVESYSTWFVWTAGNDGPLTFTLTPINAPDDLDFVVYEFPNGPGDCTGKIPLRCMASSCQGPTGLNLSSTDVSEPPNCLLPTQDNFLSALQMETGKTYGLMVNNFSTTQIGFEIEFGGTGEFAGPQAMIGHNMTEPGCINEPVTFFDATSFPLGAIVGWEWEFGPGATPANAFTAGPHQVSYNSPGVKPVLLRLTTANGCVVSVVETVEIICCDGQYQAIADISQADCPGAANGSISLSVSNPNGPYTFEWSNSGAGPGISNLAPGDYSVTISDAAGCDTTMAFTITEPPAFSFDTTTVMPTCNGGMDGVITFDVSGGTQPYAFSWQGGPFIPDNSMAGLQVGIYDIMLRDANGCEVSFEIPLQELELELDPTVDAVFPPVCNGDANASIQLTISNGLPPYQYDFHDGNGFVGANSLSGLGAGQYQVDVLDANLCQGNFSFEVADPAELTLGLEEMPISCFGEADGVLSAMPEGGTGSYAFRWSTGSTGGSIDGLAAGEYTVTITDASGCSLSQSYVLGQPDPVGLVAGKIENVICHGEATGSITLEASGGALPYSFSLDGTNFQPGAIFTSLPAGSYEAVVEDSRGCRTSLATAIAEPPPLQVDAGERQVVILGYEARLRAIPNNPDVSFEWAPAAGLDCADCPSPTTLPLRNTVYVVEVKDSSGCTARDSVEVAISDDRPVYIPNAFSPNDDGRNDVFTAYGGPGMRGILSLKVYNRWGGLSYEQQNLSVDNPVVAWDGRAGDELAPPGVYTYVF
ncbi:MAG: gliding motility-associated C-terminal domain-containing protein, partial [Phaeodactylibacter sp.]|nr:gliding motility-associated C-terminal domain-containing protein [Phaeodactylibacter sp.]